MWEFWGILKTPSLSTTRKFMSNSTLGCFNTFFSISEDKMGQNISKTKELATLLDQVAGDHPRLTKKFKLIQNVKDADSFEDFLRKAKKNNATEKDIALALIFQVTVVQVCKIL